jgi:16S rRNA (guanine527-N7)-methyltransferase
VTPTSPDWLAEQLKLGLTELPGSLQLEPPASSYPLLAGYVDRLLEWGARINLTGARDAATVVAEHLVDAIPACAQLPAEPFVGIDVGSGAGLPGVVLAALRPDSHWTLLEPTQKKVAFLAQVRRDFAAAGNRAIEVQRGRIEDFGAEEAELARTFDVAISRAVWDPAEWLARGRVLVRPGGLLLGLRSEPSEATPSGTGVLPYACAGRQRALLRVDL